MADRFGGDVPRHWNCYRPNNPSADRHSSTYPKSDKRQSWTYDSGKSDHEPPSPYNNPNSIPLTARHAQAPKRDGARPHSGPIPIQKDDNDDLPRLWSAELDDLMGRTSRAYDLVIRYERRSGGGTRWSPESIEAIREAGRDIDYEFHMLQDWRQRVSRQGTGDKSMMRRISDDAVRMADLCERVQELIQAYERPPGYGGQWVEANGSERPVDVSGRRAAAAQDRSVERYGTNRSEGEAFTCLSA